MTHINAIFNAAFFRTEQFAAMELALPENVACRHPAWLVRQKES